MFSALFSQTALRAVRNVTVTVAPRTRRILGLPPEVFDTVTENVLVRDRLRERFANEHKEFLGGMLQGVASPPGADAVFIVRAGVVTSVEIDGDKALLNVNGRVTRWPSHAALTLRHALSLKRFTLTDLGEELDLAGRLTLARRLMAEGALRT